MELTDHHTNFWQLGVVFAGEQAPAEEKPLSVKKEKLITATATVEAIDMQKRVVTLKGPKGNVLDVTVGQEARNLDQVKVGDQVKLKYHESLALRLVKPGEGVAGVEETEALARAKQEEARRYGKPSGNPYRHHYGNQ